MISKWGIMGGAIAVVGLVCALLLIRGSGDVKPSDALEGASVGLTEYDVSMRLNPDERTLTISCTIEYVNDTGIRQDSVPLRIYAGAFSSESTSPAALDDLYDACYPEGFSAGGVASNGAWWRGELTDAAFVDDARTCLSVSTPGLEPGERGEMLLHLMYTLPVCAHRFGLSGDSLTLCAVLPQVALFENGSWRTDEAAALGDPMTGACANYTVALTAPREWDCVCSGLEQSDTERDGQRTRVYRQWAARDFSLALRRNGARAEATQNGTRVIALARDGAAARRALALAKDALAAYDKLLGAYPYPTFAVCEGGAPQSALHHTALCVVGSSFWNAGNESALETQLARGAAHQWFGVMVGSDQALQPWQDEAACEYAMLLYTRARHGQSAMDALFEARGGAAMRMHTVSGITPGSPADWFSSANELEALAAQRASALYQAVSIASPSGAEGFLKTYAKTFAFRHATRAQFEALLNECSGMDMTPFVVDYLDTVMNTY